MPKIGEYLFEGDTFKSFLFDKRISIILSSVNLTVAKLTLVGPETSKVLRVKCYLVKKSKKQEEEHKIPLDFSVKNENLNILGCFFLSQDDYIIKYDNDKMFHLKFIERTKFSVWKDNDNVEFIDQ
jgi:hypothetical protein